MKVKKIVTKLMVLLSIFCNPLFLYSEGKPASELVHMADTTGKTGINYILAYLYDYERFWYAVVCSVSVIIFGLLITWVISKIVKTKGHGAASH